MQGIWPIGSRMRVKRWVDLIEVTHDRSKVLKSVWDVSKEQAIRDDDRLLSNRNGIGKVMDVSAGKIGD